MKRIASGIAIIGFFVLAFVGWISDVPVFVSGIRALAGAAAIYVLVNLAGSAAIRILIGAALKAHAAKANARKEKV
jgi:hypothetical protein